MLHCLNTSGNVGGSCSDMTVLERQRARRKWQQEHHHSNEEEQGKKNLGFTCGTGFNGAFSSSLQVQNHEGLMMMMMNGGGGGDSTLSEVVGYSMKPDPGLENGWPDLGKFDMGFVSSRFDVNSTISNTCGSEKESLKRKKAEKVQNSKVVAGSDKKEKRVKISGEEEEESKVTEQTSNKNVKPSTSNRSNTKEASGDTSKENSKGSEVQNPKPDYIHVRARRGQATDSHSLAERVRREKISERMKYLQGLVPGCNKITGKAGMLDEIINYVQSLQRQVEFLSMKLATVNPRVEFNIEDLFTKEVFPACAASFPTIEMPPDMTNNNPAYLQFNSAQQLVSCCGGLINNMEINPQDMGLQRNISASMALPETETFLDSSSSFTQILPSSTWEGDFQNIYHVAFDQARTTPFPSQPFTGLVEASNLKMGM